MDDISEKACSQCKLTKPLDRYSPLPKGKGGRHSICKPCRSKNNTAYEKQKKWEAQKYGGR